MDDTRGHDNFHYSLLHAGMWQMQPLLRIFRQSSSLNHVQDPPFIDQNVLQDVLLKSSCFLVCRQATVTSVRIWINMTVKCNYFQVSKKGNPTLSDTWSWCPYSIITNSMQQSSKYVRFVSLRKLLCHDTTKAVTSKIYWTTVKVYSSEVHTFCKCVISDFAHFTDLHALSSQTEVQWCCVSQILALCTLDNYKVQFEFHVKYW
jgi:hypothetical protein